MKIAVCWKWVSLDREREADRRWSGVSAADEAALEVALRIAEATGPDGTVDVTVICLGPAGATTCSATRSPPARRPRFVSMRRPNST
ncbi:MAG: hypothetical protein ACM3MM_05230, partial [Acidobacteriota bacterium]